MKIQRIVYLFMGVFLAAFLVLTPALAYADGFRYERQAQTLNDLGLYQGISQEQFNPDLGSALNRETGIVMLIRLFGLEAEATGINNADEILSRFSDAGRISSWARNAVAYAVQNGLVVGYPDGTIGAQQPLNGKAYCSLILRQLGYSPDYHQAPAELAARGGILPAEVQLYTNRDLIKDDLVGISYGSLKTNDREGRSVLANLIELGVVDSTTVQTVLPNLPDLSSALSTPAPAPPVPPTPTVSPSGSGHSVDRTKPTLSLVQTKDNGIVVRFSESVISAANNNGARNLANFELLDINGNFLENAASISESIPQLQFEVGFDSLLKGKCGEFTVDIKGVSDQSGNIMEDYQQRVSIIPFSLEQIQ